MLPSGMYLLPSSLGYILTGRYQNPASSIDYQIQSCFVMCDTSTSEQMMVSSSSVISFRDTPNMDTFWNLDSIGIKDSPYVTDDDVASQHFHNTIRMVNGRYEVTWPWKSDDRDLPDNYPLALGRLKSLSRRFQADRALLTAYDSILQNQLKNGIIERVSADSTDSTFCHYLPHHPIISPSKATTKVRIVYDASAKTRKTAKSLNDCLHRDQ